MLIYFIDNGSNEIKISRLHKEKKDVFLAIYAILYYSHKAQTEEK